MDMPPTFIRKTHEALMPTRVSDFDPGHRLLLPKSVTIRSRSSQIIDTGVTVMLPSKTCGLIVPCQELTNRGITLVMTVAEPASVDSIKVVLTNHRSEAMSLARRTGVARLIVLPCCLADAVDGTDAYVTKSTDTGTDSGENVAIGGGAGSAGQ